MSDAEMPVSEQELLQLASADLANYRTAREQWLRYGTQSEAFEPEIRERILSLYSAMTRIAAIRIDGAESEALRETILQKFDWPVLASASHTLMQHAGQDGDTPQMSVLQEIGYGPVNVVFGLVQLMQVTPAPPELIEKCCAAARDAAKIMRLLIKDLDLELRAKDEANKPHDINHFTDKWDDMRLTSADRSLRVRLSCSFRGEISARCLETSTIDSISYALIESAKLTVEGDTIDLAIFAVSDLLTRWVVHFRGSPPVEDASGDLSGYFRRRIEPGAFGCGFTRAAALISECFGLDDTEEAISRGYLGGRVTDERTFLWFHWPANRGVSL